MYYDLPPVLESFTLYLEEGLIILYKKAIITNLIYKRN